MIVISPKKFLDKKGGNAIVCVALGYISIQTPYGEYVSTSSRKYLFLMGKSGEKQYPEEVLCVSYKHARLASLNKHKTKLSSDVYIDAAAQRYSGVICDQEDAENERYEKIPFAYNDIVDLYMSFPFI